MRAQTILASVVAHGVVIVAVAASRGGEVDREATARAPVVELVPLLVESTPVEVAFVEVPADTAADTEPRAEPRAAQTAPAAAPQRAAIATGEKPADTRGVLRDAPPPRPPSGYFAMRRPDLALPAGVAERIAAGGTAPTVETPTDPKWAHDPKIKLQPSGNETQVRDRVAKFHVAKDGTIASVVDAPDFTIRLNLPSPSKLKKRFAKELDAWRADPYRDTRVGKMQDLPKHLTAAEGACESFNDSMCITSEDWQKQWEMEDEAVAEGSLLGGKADITGFLQRKFVGDPYASRKLKILDQTRDDRIAAGTVYRREQQNRSAELVHDNLERLWRTVADPAERRAALFALWDECAEGEAGDRARGMVIGWIRARFPQSSPHAYTADELVRLDAGRTSRQHFAPY